MSKGSRPRPYSVNLNTFNNNWDNIFRKPTPQEVDDSKAEDEAFDQIEKSTEIKDSDQGG